MSKGHLFEGYKIWMCLLTISITHGKHDTWIFQLSLPTNSPALDKHLFMSSSSAPSVHMT